MALEEKLSNALQNFAISTISSAILWKSSDGFLSLNVRKCLYRFGMTLNEQMDYSEFILYTISLAQSGKPVRDLFHRIPFVFYTYSFSSWVNWALTSRTSNMSRNTEAVLKYDSTCPPNIPICTLCGWFLIEQRSLIFFKTLVNCYEKPWKLVLTVANGNNLNEIRSAETSHYAHGYSKSNTEGIPCIEWVK